MSNLDYEQKVIRDSSALTVSYVASDVRGADDNLDLTWKNQVILLIDLTFWSLTSAEMIVEFSNDWITYYQESSIEVDWWTGSVSLFEYTFSAEWNYRIAFPIKDKFMKVSVKGTWTATWSSCKITNITWLA